MGERGEPDLRTDLLGWGAYMLSMIFRYFFYSLFAMDEGGGGFNKSVDKMAPYQQEVLC